MQVFRKCSTCELDVSLIDESAETVYVSRSYFGKNLIEV